MADAPARIAGLTRGQTLTLIGTDAPSLRAALENAATQTRQILVLDVEAADSLAGFIEQVVDDLAELALALWPNWYPGVELEPTTLPSVRQPWRRAAGRMAAAGRRPRFRRTPRQIEFAQLLLAIEPGGLVLLASLDTAAPRRASLMIDALAWCARQGAGVIIATRTRPPAEPPYQRILYGALTVVTPTAPVVGRLITPHGKPRHATAIERRFQAALRLDPELASLFECDALVPTGDVATPFRVDLLWREGRVVVELDGPEQQRDPNFGHDRHRDYELLVAGYAVLRLTDAQVESDLALALEKIRRVVRPRREGGLDENAVPPSSTRISPSATT